MDRVRRSAAHLSPSTTIAGSSRKTARSRSTQHSNQQRYDPGSGKSGDQFPHQLYASGGGWLRGRGFLRSRTNRGRYEDDGASSSCLRCGQWCLPYSVGPETQAQQIPVDPSQVALDPNKRYYISILPGDSGNPFSAGAGAPVQFDRTIPMHRCDNSASHKIVSRARAGRILRPAPEHAAMVWVEHLFLRRRRRSPSFFKRLPIRRPR